MYLVTLCHEDGRRLSFKHGSWWGKMKVGICRKRTSTEVL